MVAKATAPRRENVPRQMCIRDSPSSIDANKKRWYAVKFLEKDSKVAESVKLTDSAAKKIEELRAGLEKSHDDDMESIVTDERYKFIQKIVGTTVKKGKDKLTTSDKIDKIVTNRILGIPIFIAVMFVVYYISVTTIGTIVTDWTNAVSYTHLDVYKRQPGIRITEGQHIVVVCNCALLPVFCHFSSLCMIFFRFFCPAELSRQTRIGLYAHDRLCRQIYIVGQMSCKVVGAQLFAGVCTEF